MSMMLAVQVWKLDLDKTTTLVLMALCDSAEDDGTRCFASEDYLMWKTHVSRATLYRVFNWLSERKIITRREWSDGSVETTIVLDNAPQKTPWKRPKRGGKRIKRQDDSLTMRPFESHHETLCVSQRDPLSLTARPFESHHETDTVGAEPEPVSDDGAFFAPIHPITHPITHPINPSYLARSAPNVPPRASEGRAERAQTREMEKDALKRDPLYGAFVRNLSFEPETRQMWDEWRVGINELNRLHATPQDISKAVSAFYSRFPKATCSVRAIVKWWSALREGKSHDIAKLEASQRSTAIAQAEARERDERQRAAARAEREQLERDIAAGLL